MTFKELFHLNIFSHKIKLDQSEVNNDIKEVINQDSIDDDSVDKKCGLNEWNQEYELIYLSYILEK